LNKDAEALKLIKKALELEPGNKNWQELLNDLELRNKKTTKQSNPMSGFDPSMLSSMLGGMGGQGGLDFGAILNNPQFMNMASSMLQNPQVQQMMSSMMGGQSTPVPKESIDALKLTEEYQSSTKIQSFVDELEQVGMSAISKYMADSEIQKFVFKIAQGSFNGVNPFSQFKNDKEGEGDQDPDTSNLYL